MDHFLANFRVFFPLLSDRKLFLKAFIADTHVLFFVVVLEFVFVFAVVFLTGFADVIFMFFEAPAANDNFALNLLEDIAFGLFLGLFAFLTEGYLYLGIGHVHYWLIIEVELIINFKTNRRMEKPKHTQKLSQLRLKLQKNNEELLFL